MLSYTRSIKIHHPWLIMLRFLLFTPLLTVTSTLTCSPVSSLGTCQQFPNYHLPNPNQLDTLPNSHLLEASKLLSCPGFLTSTQQPLPDLFPKDSQLTEFTQLSSLFSCYSIIDSSLGRECNSDLPTLPPLCPSTCTKYWSNFYPLLTNTTLCPDPKLSLNSLKTLSRQCLTTLPNLNSFSSPDEEMKLNTKGISSGSSSTELGSCLNHNAVLIKGCGLETDSQLKEFCTISPRPPCCSIEDAFNHESSSSSLFSSRNPWFLTGLVLVILSLLFLSLGIGLLCRARSLLSRARSTNSTSPPTHPSPAQVQAQNSALTLTRSPIDSHHPKFIPPYLDSTLTSFTANCSPHNSVILGNDPESPFATMKSQNRSLEDQIGTAYFPYQSVLPDELTLEVGDQIAIQHQFDDGWGLGRRLATGAIGAFPLTCLQLPTSVGSNPHSHHQSPPPQTSTLPSSHPLPPGPVTQVKLLNPITRRTSSQRISRFLPQSQPQP